MLGLGVWKMANGRETEQAVEWAFEAGYRHIDTASMYRNEESVGAAVRRSGLSREEVFVTTKFFPTRIGAERELEKSLRRLALDYVDLYLIHWPVPLLNSRHWRGLEALQGRGLAREIGVSNFSSEQLEKLRRDGLPTPAVNQVHFNPFHYPRQVLEYCDAHEIAVVAYSPLDQGKGLGHPEITRLAAGLGRTPAQVMLRWALQHGTIVIPKSSDRERIRSNAEIFDFELDDAAMRTLDRL